MRPGQLFPRAFTSLLVAAGACVTLACGSTSVSQITGPSDVRCQTSLAATPQSVGPDGGTVTITVSTTRDCAWTTSSEASWIRLSTDAGQGEATFTASVEANPQVVSRTGNVSVNAQRLSIAQQARPCTFSLADSSAQFGSSGGAGRISVTTLSGCSWRAATTEPWIQVPQATSSGSGTIEFQVAANDGAERRGAVSIADLQFVVVQAAAAPGTPPGPTPLPNCTATVVPLTIGTAAAATSQAVQVSIGQTCAWTAVSNAPWITVASPGGTGPATVMLAVAANLGAARTGTVMIAGQQVTVNQAALSCTFTLNPTSQSLAAGGGSGRFTVTTQSACAWTATENVSWITLANASGTGTGDVTFSVQANTATTARSATISAGGQSFTVNQAAAACAYTLSPTSFSLEAGGGPNRVEVTTSSGCAWTAVAGAAWVSISNESGTGPGAINFRVQANTETTARSTTITVGGQAATITQAGVACTYALNPTAASIGAGGGNGQFTVTTQGGCAWSVTGGADWVTVTAPAGGSGSGTGDVTYTVQANPDATPRTATLNAGGQAYTISQAAAAAPCTYTLNPASGSFESAAAGGTFTVTTAAGCAWTATTADPWIMVNTAGGTGTGDVSFSLQANATGAVRTGAITVAGQTYSVTQAP